AWGRRGQELADRGQVTGCLALLRRAPGEQQHLAVGLYDADGLGERGYGPGRVLEGVEAGDDVEAVVFERQLLELALEDRRARHAPAGVGEERLAGVEPADVGATVGCEAEDHPGAAAGIEQARACADAELVESGGERRRDLSLLNLGPVVCSHAPEPALDVPASCCRAGGHRFLLRRGLTPPTVGATAGRGLGRSA